MKKGLTLLLVVFITMFFLPPAYAANGSGDGSGGGSSEALALVASVPTDGAKDVETDVTIELVFNKNVANMSVKDNNRTGFTLSSSDGHPVSIEVIFPDDQVEPDKKRTIYIKPQHPLLPETNYTLLISEKLTAKSGAQLPKAVSVSFTTKAESGNPANNESTGEQPKADQPKITTEQDPTKPVIPKESVEETTGAKQADEDITDIKKTTDTADTSDISDTSDTSTSVPVVETDSGERETDSLALPDKEDYTYSIVLIVVLLCAGAVGFYIIKRRKRK